MMHTVRFNLHVGAGFQLFAVLEPLHLDVGLSECALQRGGLTRADLDLVELLQDFWGFFCG